MSFKNTVLFIFSILLIDQVTKFYIKTHFQLYEDVEVFPWFKIYFVENDGMAWGTRFSDIFPFISEYHAKRLLSVFRLVAVAGIGYWLYSTVKAQTSTLLTLAIALVFAGALGNIIDSVGYGVLFTDSHGQVAQFLPEKGYAPLLHGKVVDMLYFPLWKGYLPEWLPFAGGKYFVFFEPVFNIADIAISLGFLILLIFNKRAFEKQPKTGK